jgi:LPS O-antigen subunit length determinant protein (WzzB/FepE family)
MSLVDKTGNLNTTFEATSRSHAQKYNARRVEFVPQVIIEEKDKEITEHMQKAKKQAKI